MKLNTALAVSLAGISLWSICPEVPSPISKAVSHACSALVMLIALATLGEYLSGVSFGIDHALVRDTVNFPGDIPGRMPVRIALCLAMLAAALWLLARDHAAFSKPIQTLAFASIFIAASGLVGYMYGVSETQQHRHFLSPIAANTAAVITLLGIGIALSREEFSLRNIIASDSPAGSTARRLLPAAVGVPVTAGWLLTQGRHSGYFSEQVELALFTVVTMTGLGIVILWNAGALIGLDARRKKSETEIRRLNDELLHRIGLLEASTREIESFSYSVSHDLRTPLRAIDGFSRILLEEYREQLDDEGKRLLTIVRHNTKKMAQLIDDILHFSRMGRVDLAPADIDMAALIHDIVEELRPIMGDRDIVIEIGTLPPARGDRSMIHQVFVNLIANAIKFTSLRESAHITLSATVTEKEHVYSVQDNGAGFDMQYAGKLFGVFQRLHGVDEFEGTGIGLAIVKRIVTRHGGRVWAEGTLDEGAVFYVALPAKETEHG